MAQDQARALRVVVSVRCSCWPCPSATEEMGLHIIKGAELLRQDQDNDATGDYTHTAIAVQKFANSSSAPSTRWRAWLRSTTRQRKRRLRRTLPRQGFMLAIARESRGRVRVGLRYTISSYACVLHVAHRLRSFRTRWRRNRPDGGDHDLPTVPMCTVVLVPVGIEAQKNEQGYQAAKCISFEPVSRIPSAERWLVARSAGLVQARAWP